ncbi:hypothetical protein QYE76_068377 [Lolium multiflorum]|uniref:Aminotransferase-like plant mobile domain-containing protein n=1 Tax=Lolium multiflorum TaxID=4521 RepID=A0AAD8SEC5_LOLMU|nr:hypothetical protein QYE76_068377 [Lolium multiflorum]
MAYDERYTEFIQPETHTFHLSAGEMTPTLQDVSMILGLPIQGEPLCMNTASDGWRTQIEDLIGMAPPPPGDPKDRTPAGAPFAWIRTHFGECPQGAERDTLRTYTRVYLWYTISRTLFADSGGKLAHWCWLKALTVLEHRWSWGTAALAYLYRQVMICCMTGSGGIGGCLLLLSVWSWDRLSVGRPRVLTERPWPHYRNNLDREPTWAFLWDNVSEMTSDPKIMYKHYTKELDTLTAEQVDWEPYGTYYHIGAGMADLNPKCVEEARFWRMRCPLICMWLVEYHQPHRVMRQFGLYQECPPQWQDTDHALHKLDRQRQRKITNWPVHHRGHVTAFQHCLEAVRNVGHVEIVPHDLAAFNNYLQWFHQSTRIELVKPAYDDQILDDPIEFDEVAQSQHGIYTRKGRSTSIASELNFVRSEIQKTAEECEIVWDQSHTDEKPNGPMRHFIKLKPRGKAPKRYTPDDYVNRGKKVVIQEDETPPRRSTLRRMRNDEPLSSEEEEQQEQQQQEPQKRTKRLAVRKQPQKSLCGANDMGATLHNVAPTTRVPHNATYMSKTSRGSGSLVLSRFGEAVSRHTNSLAKTGMARIVHVHHVDKDSFLKGNIDPDPDEVDLVFERSPNYAEVLEKVRIDLNWMDPSNVVELEGRHNAGFGMHVRWKTMRINSEQRWVAYKEVVAESLDKALELFATKKVDTALHLDLNRLASPLNGTSHQPLNQEEISEPRCNHEANDEEEEDGNEVELHENNVGDFDKYYIQENMDRELPYSRCYASDSDDDGPDEEIDEEGFTAK